MSGNNRHLYLEALIEATDSLKASERKELLSDTCKNMLCDLNELNINKNNINSYIDSLNQISSLVDEEQLKSIQIYVCVAVVKLLNQSPINKLAFKLLIDTNFHKEIFDAFFVQGTMSKELLKQCSEIIKDIGQKINAKEIGSAIGQAICSQKDDLLKLFSNITSQLNQQELENVILLLQNAEKKFHKLLFKNNLTFVLSCMRFLPIENLRDANNQVFNESIAIYLSEAWDDLLQQELSYMDIAKIVTLLEIKHEGSKQKKELECVFREKLNNMGETDKFWQSLQVYFNSKIEDSTMNWVEAAELLSIFEKSGTVSSENCNLCGISSMLNLISLNDLNTLFEIFKVYIEKNVDGILPMAFHAHDNNNPNILHRIMSSIKRDMNPLVGYQLDSYPIIEAYRGITGTDTIANSMNKMGYALKQENNYHQVYGYKLPHFLLNLMKLGYSKAQDQSYLQDDDKFMDHLKANKDQWNILHIRGKYFAYSYRNINIDDLQVKNSFVDKMTDLTDELISHLVVGKFSLTENNRIQYEVYDSGRYHQGETDIQEFKTFYLGLVAFDMTSPKHNAKPLIFSGDKKLNALSIDENGNKKELDREEVLREFDSVKNKLNY